LEERIACEWIGDVASGVGAWSCPGSWSAALHLARLIESDESDPAVVRLVERLCFDRPTARVFCERVQQWVRENVPFVRESVELFQSPDTLLASSCGGDCDCHARLVASMLAAAGVRFRVVFFGGESGATHVAVQALCGVCAFWLETTLPAAFGEHPFAAHARIHK